MKKYIIIGLFFTITIISSVSIVMFLDYKKEELTQESKRDQLKLEQNLKNQQETEKQKLLDAAIAQAKENRTALYESNKNPSANTIKIIEDRYNNEVQTAIDRYK